MRHRIFGRKLNRTSAHRTAMRRNMAIALFQHGAIRTTLAKAKEIKPFVEKMITAARQGTIHARRRVSAELGNRSGRRGDLFDKEEKREEKGVLQKLFDEIAPRYADRPGGYTRIIRLAERRLGDGGKQVILQLVEQAKGQAGDATGGTSRRRGRRRPQAAEPSAEDQAGLEQPQAEDLDESDTSDQGQAAGENQAQAAKQGQIPDATDAPADEKDEA